MGPLALDGQPREQRHPEVPVDDPLERLEVAALELDGLRVGPPGPDEAPSLDDLDRGVAREVARLDAESRAGDA